MSRRKEFASGAAELRAARSDQNGLLVAVIIFSSVVNILMLTGPLYMLQVYDRVLGSRSEATLLALSGLVVMLFLAMGLLDHARSRILARIGARIQDRLDRRVFAAALRRLVAAPNDPLALTAQKDLEAIQRLWSSPLLTALMDMPWAPFFIGVTFILHPVMGILSVVGGLVIVGIALWNQAATKGPVTRATMVTHGADRISELLKQEAETIRAMGMTGAAFDRWQQARALALSESIAVADAAGGFGALSRTFRLFLQSAILGVGAWLVLEGQLGAGAMIAGSILMGRALAPVEQVVAQWAVWTRATEARERLSELLSRVPVEPQPTALPRPRAALDVQSISVIPPGEQQAVLRGVAFQLEPGQALGVIGPSGAGKSTLARALIGVWRPAAGKIRLDGAALDQYDPDVLGSYIGYLPQHVALFDGTIAENIGRLDANRDDAKIVEAARAAAAHDLILSLPDGYDTRVSAIGGRLSGGQIQRIGLARALYGDPVLLILDEPNSALDNDGSVALNHAVRRLKAAGGAVLIMTHRPAAIQECDLLLVLDNGMRRAFGPRDQVLREMVKNHTEIVRAPGPGGVV